MNKNKINFGGLYMKLIIKTIFFIFLANILFCFELYKSSYDIMFSKLNIEKSNDILNLFEEGFSRGEKGVNETDKKLGYEMVCGALKRIGELKLTSAKSRIKDLIRKFNVLSGDKKVGFVIDMKKVFNLSVWALGKIANDDDIKFLANFIDPYISNEDYHSDTIYIIILALGDAKGSPTALNLLYDLLKRIKNESLIIEVINSIVKHNKVLSIAKLIDFKEMRSGQFSPNLIKYVNKSIEKLANEGE